MPKASIGLDKMAAIIEDKLRTGDSYKVVAERHNTSKSTLIRLSKTETWAEMSESIRLRIVEDLRYANTEAQRNNDK